MASTRRRAGSFSSVLCAIDFSKHSRSALRYAAAVVAHSGGSLTALFVNDPLLVAAAAAAYDQRALASRSAAELERFVHGVLGRSAAVATLVSMGEPAREIQKAATRIGAGLIVVGSEGLSGAQKLFFGSTTSRLLTHAGVPVLAVPPSGPPPAKAAGWPGRRILAAIDLGRDAAGDVAAATDVARWFDARLALVHIVERTRAPRWLPVKAGGDRERLALARTRLGRLVAGAGPGATVDVHVLVGDPAPQIAALATDISAGLMVVTLRGDNRLFGDRKGATTYRVLREAGTPVLALPAGWRLGADQPTRA